MLRSRLAIFVLGLIAGYGSLRADTVTIDDGDPQKRVTVTIRDSRIGSVLAAFGKAYGFEVVKPEAVEPGGLISATMTGSLEEILTRLLRNMNHLIVHSPGNRGGIAKIILFTERSAPTLRRQEAAPLEPSPRDAHRQYSAQQGRD